LRHQEVKSNEKAPSSIAKKRRKRGGGEKHGRGGWEGPQIARDRRERVRGGWSTHQSQGKEKTGGGQKKRAKKTVKDPFPGGPRQDRESGIHIGEGKNRDESRVDRGRLAKNEQGANYGELQGEFVMNKGS